jgi:hypothetical protein
LTSLAHPAIPDQFRKSFVSDVMTIRVDIMDMDLSIRREDADVLFGVS